MSLTERDLQFMGQIFQCFKEAPVVDFEKLASVSGYANKASATTAYHRIRAKLTSLTTGAEGSATAAKAASKAAPKPTRYGKAAVADAAARDEEEADDADEEVPAAATKKGTKKGIKKAGKATASKAAVHGADNSEDDVRGLSTRKKAPAGKGEKRAAEDDEESEAKRSKAYDDEE